MRIGELERLTGLSRHTLRFYERERLIVAPTRTRAGYRAYDARHVEQVAFITEARRLGFGLKEIGVATRELFAPGGSCAALLASLGGRREAVLAEIERLRAQAAAIQAWIEKFSTQCDVVDRWTR